MLDLRAGQINVSDGTSDVAAPKAVIPAKAGIQYAAAYRINHNRLWNTGSPAFAGDDG
jgi:hypothetical protein